MQPGDELHQRGQDLVRDAPEAVGRGGRRGGPAVHPDEDVEVVLHLGGGREGLGVEENCTIASLESGGWKLDIGHWTLEFGKWKLEVGSWNS